MNIKRARALLDIPYKSGPVIYWMSRDQRVNDNWALLYAQKLAKEHKTHIEVIFTLVPKFLDATLRQYDFMLKGLEEVEEKLKEKNIPFHMLLGNPSDELAKFIEKNNTGVVVCDFDPLRIKKEWKRKLVDKANVPIIEVDAHNIIPVWIASTKQEFGAYTIRPKINKLLFEFMDEFPKLEKQQGKFNFEKIDFQKLLSKLEINREIKPVSWIKPGEKEASKMFKLFIEKKLHNYAIKRNDPSLDFLSNLSPYLHFGQISAQRIALEMRKVGAGIDGESFIEELVIRRELADNFCHYNSHYDSYEGFPNWAKISHEEHRRDVREYIYSLDQFENSKTHDDLWNAAQLEMVLSGKMHGYMRMYWAKKILEWTPSVEEAMKIAIYLNDKYELDGRDPNGYVGVAWSLGGVHDRAWFNRNVFGKIRFMSYNGCKGKFDIKAYIKKVESMKQGKLL